MDNNKNITLAVTLSAIVLIAWTWFYEKPRVEKQEQHRRIVEAQNAFNNKDNPKQVLNQKQQAPNVARKSATKNKDLEIKAVSAIKNRDEIIDKSQNERIKISSGSLHGSISLRGARFDDLTLAKYFTDAKKDTEVVLFSPAQSKDRYFADFGWVSSNSDIELPKPNSLWQASSNLLTNQNPVTLSWKNSDNIEFLIRITLDENYMFEVTQTVKNNSKKDLSIASYGRINRVLNSVHKPMYILHEGAIGVFEGILQEITYKELVEDKQFSFNENNGGGWLGITDKYWLSSILPDKNFKYQASFTSDFYNQNNLYNSEFIGQEFLIAPRENITFKHHLFAGAKKVKLLDQYSKKYDAKLFDRAVDFGWFYFLTKPFFFMISFLNKFLGNFGLAILAMTVIVKLALFPMANKSYAAIGRIKKLQPKIDDLRKRFKDDKMGMNRAMMELYKKEGVNPASGCLPVLIQIPIFFSLYKVLFVTIDMRHAPFYGWIKDLSAPDPTSIFNLFGLLPFEVGPAFAIGIWPILMGITMMLQQKLSPASSDPTQAKILKWMPYVLTFVLAAFPAGLVIYWTWSNSLSILQQWVITRKLNKES